MTTLAACAIGIITAIVMHPGTETLREDLKVFTQASFDTEIQKPLDANLDIIR